MTKKRNKCLNFFKGIACFGVIGAHIDLQGLIGQGFLSLIAWTVPFFFMISGYYSYYEDEEKFFKKNKQKAINIFKVALISLAFYFLVTFFDELLKNNLGELLKEIFQLKTFFDVLILNDFTVINAGHLWFLLSLVYCYLILGWAIKHKKINFMYWLVPIILIARMIGYKFIATDWHYLQNAFTCGIPCFFTGYYLATHQNLFNQMINKLSNNQLRIIIIVGILLNFLGTFIQLPINIFEFGTVIAYISIFTFAQKNPDMYVSTFFETVGTKYSGYIYIIHMFFILILRFIFNKLNLNNISGSIYIRLILVSILSLLFAVICEKSISNKSKKKKS